MGRLWQPSVYTRIFTGLAVALVLGLAACGGGGDDEPPPCESPKSRNASGECVEPVARVPPLNCAENPELCQ